VLRVRGLIEAGRAAEALAAAQDLARSAPEDRDILYMIAVCQRQLSRLDQALETLDRLRALHPGYSRLFQERGHCYIAARDPAAALDSYLQAVSINPALPASWKALSVLFQSAGRPQDARMAAGHLDKLAHLPPPVVIATSLFHDGDVPEAEQVIRDFLKSHGHHVEAMRLLAKIGLRQDVLDDAELLLEGVLSLAPDHTPARYDYVQVLLQSHQHQKALEQAEILLERDPANHDYRAVYATACLSVGRFEQAIATYRALAAETPRVADLHLSIAHALKTLGRQSEAIDSYRMAAEIRPDFGDAWWSLANLKTYRFTDAEIERMRREEGRAGIAAPDRYHLCFALGKALEDRGEHESSFRYYERGNALKRCEIRYRPETVERNAEQQKAVFTPALLAARRGSGCERPDPIFVVGLPRAGSTLLEQILASHSQVEGTMELADIGRLAQRLPNYPAALAELPAEDLRAMGEKYLADTRIHRGGKPFFIDKNPNNFRHIGLIHLILPNARIIDARREPMACCFSNFKQLFAQGQEFTYGLEDIARYYRLYVDLMAHWDAVLPGRILRVQHEEVVEDLEGNVRRLLDYCGLPFEPRCLEFYKTERTVRTASSEQVRRPIFKDGLDQWRRFEPWLGPLRDALSARG
jgi:tetratricopeptide (TPR) repeat protein